MRIPIFFLPNPLNNGENQPESLQNQQNHLEFNKIVRRLHWPNDEST